MISAANNSVRIHAWFFKKTYDFILAFIFSSIRHQTVQVMMGKKTTRILLLTDIIKNNTVTLNLKMYFSCQTNKTCNIYVEQSVFTKLHVILSKHRLILFDR